ncbi:hypothetical protein GGS23DRAFT_518433 [Durotheca rogersii]|uniref:uncharacterized protein n=1 Tax=Durotheca rogersii TaxID=419775 RepID=UPI00221E4976|nr:uncharacterized protein GGS23DRAFT_518433 [Durotheca rogersii]KAI5863884.1 hypothetical protein GGS23DRAFT_518433 [Durotheca rogersii]
MEIVLWSRRTVPSVTRCWRGGGDIARFSRSAVRALQLGRPKRSPALPGRLRPVGRQEREISAALLCPPLLCSALPYLAFLPKLSRRRPARWPFARSALSSPPSPSHSCAGDEIRQKTRCSVAISRAGFCFSLLLWPARDSWPRLASRRPDGI